MVCLFHTHTTHTVIVQCFSEWFVYTTHTLIYSAKVTGSNSTRPTTHHPPTPTHTHTHTLIIFFILCDIICSTCYNISFHSKYKLYTIREVRIDSRKRHCRMMIRDLTSEAARERKTRALRERSPLMTFSLP